MKSLRRQDGRALALPSGLRRLIAGAKWTGRSNSSPDGARIESLEPCDEAGAGGLRFGIILNTPGFTCWEANCVSRLLKSGICRLQVIVVAQGRSEHLLRRLLRIIRYPVWTVYTAHSAYPQTSKLLKSNSFSEADIIHCSQDKIAILLNDDHLKRLTDHRLDFLLNFASAQLAGRLLAIPRHGVWSFNYGDDESDDSRPAAFREVVLGAPVIRISLTQFGGSQEAAAVDLRSGFFAVEPYSYAKTLDRARLASADFPVLACKDLICGRGGEPRLNSNINPSEHSGIPGNRIMLGLILGSFRGKALRVLRSAFTQLAWNSGFMDIGDLDPTKSRTASKVRWLPVRRNSIAADPFVVHWQNQLILLTENIDRTDNRGFIEAWSVDNGQATPLGKIIEGPVHLSYPYIVAWQGSIYCIPEQARAHSIAVYRAIDFPTTWEPVGEVLSGVEAIDPTVFRYGSLWWLAYTDASIDRHGRLMLWYAMELTGPWRPHALNPVKIDPRSSRSAGAPFLYREYLVRPAQDCSGEYGARIVFNRIAKLTPEEFHEDVIGELKPDPNGRYPAGLHTICRDGEVAVVDGKAYVIDPTAWFRKFARKLPGGAYALVGRSLAKGSGTVSSSIDVDSSKTC